MGSREVQPMSTTRVPPVFASRAQSTEDSSLDGSSLPVTTVKEPARPRWVTGIPA